jgi:hypothetical protein
MLNWNPAAYLFAYNLIVSERRDEQLGDDRDHRGLALSDRELILKAGSDGQSGCGVSPLTETPILGAAVSWCAGFVPPT